MRAHNESIPASDWSISASNVHPWGAIELGVAGEITPGKITRWYATRGEAWRFASLSFKYYAIAQYMG